MGKFIVISAPSGAGKTSIVHYLLKERIDLGFSISACSRKKRENEREGRDYYFLDKEDFEKKIQENAFLEWEEVYKEQYYGTLKSEIKRLQKLNKHIVFDIDVEGGMNIKQKYPGDCLSIFIMPPSIDILKQRLIARDLDSSDNIMKRLAKAKKEIVKSKHFDEVILNDIFNLACDKTMNIIDNFIKR